MVEGEKEFIPPPEAPIFEPTEEEFQDPLVYIAKIKPIAEKTGICKIKPPADWQPPFAVDVDKFRFTPRVQRLNEMEAQSRVKLNFLDNLAKFWDLQGTALRIPNVERKHLDLFGLHKAVRELGGFEVVSKERRWSKVSVKLGFEVGRGIGSILRSHYERILYPYDLFKSGITVDPSCLEEEKPIESQHSPQKLKKEIKEDKDYVPIGMKNEKKLQDQRRSRRMFKELQMMKRLAKKKNNIVDDRTVSQDNEVAMEIKPQIKSELGTNPALQMMKRLSKKENTIVDDRTVSQDNEAAVEIKPQIKSELGTNPTEPQIDYSANNELRKLQFYGPGPKTAVAASREKDEEVKAGQRMKTREKSSSGQYIDTYMCHNCGRGDGEENMLLCDGCDDAFHTYCLVPVLPDIPKGDWRCPKCVAKECSKPLEAYGFEQAKQAYTLQSFGEYADQFKADYFGMPVHMVPCSKVEKEFWRLVNCLEEDVYVEYGADIHASECGSGFPTMATKDQFPDDVEYMKSGWNLNNLPGLEQSVLGYINANISGMKVPWCYVGMCFSSFCWHTEDHWSYSINYMHWGEPKTWYGVPGASAEDLERVMKKMAPELFVQAPDLLHMLTTTLNPNILMAHNVPMVRTNQHAGEFVVTFPRAYHAGFNQGYNFAEAVNFCPADWLSMGRSCIEHYRSLKRQCVFSHEELVCKLAADPDQLDLTLAAATHQDMLEMVEYEKKLRKSLLDKGVKEAEREAFELLPDDERQCEFCNTTCFLSAITCACSPNKLVCIHHMDHLCDCPVTSYCLRYRYTLDELPTMLHRLKVRAEAFDNWAYKVKSALEAEGDDKIDLIDLKELIVTSEEKKFPDSELLQTLIGAVSEAEKCASVANQLVSKKVRTRNRQSGESKYVAKLSLDELQCFSDQVNNLPCVISEAKLIQELLQKVIDFQTEAQDALDAETPNSEKLQKLLETGVNLDVDLPEIPQLKQVLQQARWLDEVRNSLEEPSNVTLELMRKLIESGVGLAPHPACEKAMAELQELLTVSERWEEKARICLQARPRHVMSTLEAIINEAKSIPAYLPNITALKEALRKAKEWTTKVEALQTAEHYPYMDTLESVVNKGRPIPVRLDQLPQVESQVAAAKSWRERTARTFLKKNSTFSLVDVLSPRSDIGIYAGNKNRRKKPRDMEKDRENNNNNNSDSARTEENNDPAAMVALFKAAELREIDSMRELRTRNVEKQHRGDPDSKYCLCRKIISGIMLQCELCKDWFHSTCVPLPKSTNLKSKNSQAAAVQAAKDLKFLCPLCLRSRRPRLETILSLLVSLQKLPVRLLEGEALQCLTERAMAWQDRARQELATEELASALAKLSVLSQRMVEQAAREKTEKIISAELLKAACNPELQGHLQNVTQSAFGNGIPQSLAMDSDSSMQNPPSPLHSDDTQSESELAVPMSSEHAYSTASKNSTGTSPRKHQRKSPLVARQSEPPVLELSDFSRVRLEELMMEGDLLEVSLDETQHIWRILQACQLRSQPGIVEFQDIDTESIVSCKTEKLDKAERIDIIKEKKKRKRKKKEGMNGLGEKTEEIKMERPMGENGMEVPKKKKKLKLKDKDGKHKEGAEESEIKKKKKKKQKEGEKDGEKKKKKKSVSSKQASAQDDEDDDDCSATKCLKPTGEEVNWVQCDQCELWFHLLCVGLAEDEVTEHEDYICFKCTCKARKTDSPATTLMMTLTPPMGGVKKVASTTPTTSLTEQPSTTLLNASLTDKQGSVSDMEKIHETVAMDTAAPVEMMVDVNEAVVDTDVHEENTLCEPEPVVVTEVEMTSQNSVENNTNSTMTECVLSDDEEKKTELSSTPSLVSILKEIPAVTTSSSVVSEDKYTPALTEMVS